MLAKRPVMRESMHGEMYTCGEMVTLTSDRDCAKVKSYMRFGKNHCSGESGEFMQLLE